MCAYVAPGHCRQPILVMLWLRSCHFLRGIDVNTRSFLTVLCLVIPFASLITPSSRAAGNDREKNKRAPVVAVFPFKVLNKEEKVQHLGEGAAEAIINKIVNDQALRIVEESQLDKAVHSIARNQTGFFEEESYLQVGAMVDARFIVIGSVQVVGDQIAITARLLEVERRQLLTSVRVAKPLHEVFSAYDDVASRLLSKMTYHLSQRVVGGESADELAVRQLLEEGKKLDPEFKDIPGDKNLAHALAYYDKAALRDPRNGQAQLALGHAQSRKANSLETSNPSEAKRLSRSAREHLQRAVDTSERRNAFAFIELARVEARLAARDAARSHLETAISLSPESAEGNFLLARILLDEGKLVQARQVATKAQELRHPMGDQLVVQIDQAIAMQRQKKDPKAER